MPIVGPGTYLPTMDEFKAHWESTNVSLGGSPSTDLKLKGGFTIAHFEVDRSALQTAITGIVGLENVRQLAAADRDLKKAALRSRLKQFRAAVECYLEETPYEAALPTLPDFGSEESKFLARFDDMANLWERIDADSTTPGWTGPLTLAGGYARAAFVADLAAMRESYRAVTTANQNLSLGREQRNSMLRPIVKRLKQYRKAVVSKFAEGHAQLTALPTLTPPAGATPEAVTISGTWNPMTNLADIVWSPSANPNVSHFRIVSVPALPWDTDDETLVATVPADVTTFSTAENLFAPGATAYFRIIVVLTTGNEKSSVNLKITRPD